MHEGRPAAPDEPRLGFGARTVAGAKQAAIEKVRDEAKEHGWRALVALITSWFVRALPAIALSGVVGTVAGTVAGHVAGKAAAKSSSPPAEPTKKGPVDFAAAGSGQGALDVTSEPTGGRVTLDGAIVGDAPLTHIVVDPGSHAVVVTLAGYAPYVGKIDVVSGTPATVHAVLVKEKKVAAAGPSRSTYTPPARPYRSCSSEKQDCMNRCGSIEFNCQGRCHCQDKSQDECHAIMDACYAQCKEGRLACEPQCDAAEASCEESQRQ